MTLNLNIIAFDQVDFVRSEVSNFDLSLSLL